MSGGDNIAVEVKAAVDALAATRLEEVNQCADWRYSILRAGGSEQNDGDGSSSSSSSSSASSQQRDEEMELLRERLRDAESMYEAERNLRIEAERNLDLKPLPSPGSMTDADEEYSQVTRLEMAISEQMEVIEQLTNEKTKMQSELNAAMKVLRQRDRENSTMAFQLKQILAQQAKDKMAKTA